MPLTYMHVINKCSALILLDPIRFPYADWVYVDVIVIDGK